MKVSVIVPIYNVEKYLDQCLQSLIRQTYENIEIILINDGSKDNSEKIIKKYLKTNSNIIYIKQENQGQSVARNKGIENASGQYIMFVDSDDYIELTMIEKLMKPFYLDNELDITFCDYILFDEQSKSYQKTIKNMCNDLKKNLIMASPGPCGKIFKKDIFKHFKFPEKIIYEDLAIIPNIIAKSSKVFYVREYLYYYRQNITSTTGNRVYTSKKMDILKATDILYKKHLEANDTKYNSEIEFIIIEHVMYYAALRFIRYPKAKEKLKELKKIIDRNNINFLDNKYFKKFSKDKQRIIIKLYKGKVLNGYVYLIKNKLKKIIKKEKEDARKK